MGQGQVHPEAQTSKHHDWRHGPEQTKTPETGEARPRNWDGYDLGRQQPSAVNVPCGLPVFEELVFCAIHLNLT